MPNCYYYDEQSNHCNCYVNENLNELLEENVNLRVQLANAMVTVRRIDERCAKLRELAGILCFCMQFNRDCDDCKLNGADGKFNIEACEGLRMLLQDAGIEVPE